MSGSKSESTSGGNFFLPKIEGLSLGQFQIPDLGLAESDQAPSLATLANEHLSQNGSDLFNLKLDLSPSVSNAPLDLEALANLHLETSDSSGFKIPSLFANEPPLELKSKEIVVPLSPKKGQTIDLSAALNIVPEKPGSFKKVERTPKSGQLETKIAFEVEILVQPEHWNKENWSESQQYRSQASAFGKVVSRRWRHPKSSITPVIPRLETTIKNFLFDSASPDDIVRIAQSKSTVSRSK